MTRSIMRTDKWPLDATPEQKQLMLLTVEKYRLFCRALSIVISSNWVELQKDAENYVAAVEKLIHRTARNDSPKHSYFNKSHYKFPSYLRRAAIAFAWGQVSSFMSRYRKWQSGDRRFRAEKPPRFNPDAGCYPAMYRGQLLKFDEKYTVASLKLWDGKEWLWHDVKIKAVRHRHLLGTIKSPSLIANRRCHLSVPVQMKPERLPHSERVCAVNLGINTLATASVVARNGTVAHRRFFHPGADIDRRDKLASRIRHKAKKTKNLSSGFCKGIYRKIYNINTDIAEKVSRQIVDLALAEGASVIVLENLKYWRPKGGRKRSPMRQRFHNWLHRKLAQRIEEKMKEAGGRVVYVYPRGTSSWAYDGSGKVERSSQQYELATFPNGKRYNADLNASYNIAARFWAYDLGLTRRKDGQLPGGKRSPGKSRMPITLSSLWQKPQPRESEASLQCAA